jgi:hypothetical protein
VNRDAAQTFDDFRTNGIRYLVTVRPDHELAEFYPEFLSWDAWRARAGAVLVYENPTFRLIRLPAE